jgi:hypothetical protein
MELAEERLRLAPIGRSLMELHQRLHQDKMLIPFFFTPVEQPLTSSAAPS